MTTEFPTQAMILAAGLGKRMAHLTTHIPKPMIEVAGHTLIDRAIDNLEAAGVTKIVVNTSYKAEVIEAHLSKRASSQIIFSREEQPLETGGGIANALHHFGGKKFFCVNGDVIWSDGKESALKRLAQSWSNDLHALLLLHPRETSIGYEGKGDFFCDAQGALTRRGTHETAPYIYTGIQLVHPDLFIDCPKGIFSLNVLYDKAINAAPPKLKGIIHQGNLLNVGDPTGKAQAEEFIAHKRDLNAVVIPAKAGNQQSAIRRDNKMDAT